MGAPRRFDHDEARARHAAGEKAAVLAREYGVTKKSIYDVVSPVDHEQRNEYAREYQRRTQRVTCPGGCGALVWRRHGRVPLCPACTGVARRTAEHGTESRYSRGCRCDACRKAAGVARGIRRERRKVACASCGKPRLHPNDSRSGSHHHADTGLCLACYRASLWPNKEKELSAA